MSSSSKPLKVMTILGTRPEIIRLACVMEALERSPEIDHVLVHTGQNYDYELNQIFFDELGVKKPNHYLGVDTSSLGATLGGILTETERVLVEEKPGAVLILGDTNSALSAIIAKRLKIPVYHMEAGNRSYDANVPEEQNRRIVDHIADFNLVYTEHARRHLLSEGLKHRHIHLTGSPMAEVLNRYEAGITESSVLQKENLNEEGYFLVSLHREENVDHPENLTQLVTLLNQLASDFGKDVIVSTHPRTRKRLDALDLPFDERVQLMKPFGFIDYNRLQKSAYCVLSDSGTISEESSILGFPAVTVRQSLERPEALDTGSIVLTGLDADRVCSCVRAVREDWEQGKMAPVPAGYQITNVSQRVQRLILGTAGLSHRWAGIRA